MAELADALDSKSSGACAPCGFDSHLRHRPAVRVRVESARRISRYLRRCGPTSSLVAVAPPYVQPGDGGGDAGEQIQISSSGGGGRGRARVRSRRLRRGQTAAAEAAKRPRSRLPRVGRSGTKARAARCADRIGLAAAGREPRADDGDGQTRSSSSSSSATARPATRTIGYQSCDDSTAQAGSWDSAKCSSNARSYANNESVIGVVGTFNSGCAKLEIPVANRAPNGPLAYVSPANTYPGLTISGPGTESGEPDNYYPTRRAQLCARRLERPVPGRRGRGVREGASA